MCSSLLTPSRNSATPGGARRSLHIYNDDEYFTCRSLHRFFPTARLIKPNKTQNNTQEVAGRLLDMTADVSKEANQVFGYADDAASMGKQLG